MAVQEKAAEVKAVRISAEEFIKVWQEAESPAEVAEKMGIDKLSAQGRATNYRKAGIQLKKFAGKGRPKMNVEALNAIALAYSK